MDDKRKNEIENCIKNSKPLIKNKILDFECFSPQYHKSVILNLLGKKDSFACIYGDFNKLSLINRDYKEKEGDRVLSAALRIIQECLPDDAIISRIGGDEFCFILPNKTQKEANAYIQTVYSKLEEDKDNLHKLSITMAARDNTFVASDVKSSHPIVSILLEDAETEVLEIKQQLRLQDCPTCKEPLVMHLPEEQQEAWKRLNALLSLAAKEHVRDIRPSKKYIFSTKDMRKETTSMGKALTNLLFEEEKEDSSLDCNKKFSRNFLKNKKSLHTLFTSENLEETFQELGTYQLEEVLYREIFELGKSLVYDEHSNLHNRSYLELYLTPKICENISHMHASFFSISGMRISNTAFGHQHSDIRKQKTIELLKKEIEAKLSYSHDIFCFAKPFYFFIDKGGGNYVLLTPEHIPTRFMQRIEKTVNSYYDKHDPYSPFRITSSQKLVLAGIPIKHHFLTHCHHYFVTHSSKDSTFCKYVEQKYTLLKEKKQNKFLDTIFKLQHQTDLKKDNLKSDSIDSIDTKLALEAVYRNCVEYYKKHIQNCNSRQTQQRFIENAFSALVNEYSFYNEQSREFIKKNFIENIKYTITSVAETNALMAQATFPHYSKKECEK